MLRSSDFRRVYDNGSRFAGPLFAAFFVANAEPAGPRVGFTTPRALGKAVRRNRIKRRIREALRLELSTIAPDWDVVINPRKPALTASWEHVQTEVRKLARRLGPPARE
ncbi:MAG: ribonuclease P protein component [Acidobacteria bacterium]|nr:ribonuclease P protein component [Acidobacteriota bacterium]